LDLRPNLISAWIARGATFGALGRHDQAIADYRHALQVSPRETRAYLGLIPLLRATGRDAEAERYLIHGLRVAGDPALLREEFRAR
jgi:Flp pilus assembly protein TadD